MQTINNLEAKITETLTETLKAVIEEDHMEFSQANAHSLEDDVTRDEVRFATWEHITQDGRELAAIWVECGCPEVQEAIQDGRTMLRDRMVWAIADSIYDVMDIYELTEKVLYAETR